MISFQLSLAGLLIVVSAPFAQAKSVWLTPTKSLIQKADFEPTWSRDPSPDAILAHFQTAFPLAERKYIPSNCIGLEPSNRTLLGVDDPLVGSALLRKPSPAFVGWYTSCTAALVRANFMSTTVDGPLKAEALKTYASGGLNRACLKIEADLLHDSARSFSESTLYSCPWSKLSTDVKLSVASYWIEELIGPEDVLKDLGVANSTRELAQKIIDTISDEDTKRTSTWEFLSVQAGALTAVDSVKMIQFLVSITDAFQY